MQGSGHGKVLKMGDVEQITPKFRKVSVIVESDSKFRNEIKLEATQSDADLIVQQLNVGDEASFDFRVEGQESKQGRHFVSLHITNWALVQQGANGDVVPAGAGTGGVGQTPNSDMDLPF